jgi:multidrug resistance efflux pump
MSLKESGNIIFIIKPKDYKTESDKISNQVQELTKSAQNISQQIENLQQKNTEIKLDQIVLSIMKVKKKQVERQELTAEENKQLQE